MLASPASSRRSVYFLHLLAPGSARDQFVIRLLQRYRRPVLAACRRSHEGSSSAGSYSESRQFQMPDDCYPLA
jgi:hypothetical protein